MHMKASQPMGRPHETQFLVFASTDTVGGTANGLPQLPQNLIPSGFASPQPSHFIAYSPTSRTSFLLYLSSPRESARTFRRTTRRTRATPSHYLLGNVRG